MLTFFLLGIGVAPTMAQTSSQEQTKEGQAPAKAGQSAKESGSSTETKPASSGPYSGDIWHRSTLTGDWRGVRNDLAAKGITFDMSVTQVYQGILGGGKDETWRYSGRGDTTINVDTQKLGLWPGGFFTLEMEGNWANSVNEQTGALMPVNTNQTFPLPTGDHFNLPDFA